MNSSMMKKSNIRALCLLLSICILALTGCGLFDKDTKTSTSKFDAVTDIKTADNTPTVDPDAEKFTEVAQKSDEGFSAMNFDLDNVDIADAERFIKHYSPDIFGVQNAESLTLSELSSSVGGYSRISYDDDTAGKQNAIYYKSEFFEIVRKNGISLTGTPLEKNEGDANLVYALLCSVADGRYYAVFSTSLDSGEGLEQQMFYLYSKFRCYTSYYTTVVMGALRSPEGSEGYSKLTEGGMLTYGTSADAGDIYVCSADEIHGAAVTSDKTASEMPLVTAVAADAPYNIDLDGKMIALTFDDGPTSVEGYTDIILNVLEEHNSKATFFVLGQRLTDKNPIQRSLLEREHALGFEIGNHSYDHKAYSSFSSEEGLLENLDASDALIAECTGGFQATLLRPPGGTVKKPANVDRPIINWSVDTNDWNTVKYNSDDVYNHIITHAKDGYIVLMHDIRINSPGMIEKLMTWFEENGYQCVTVSELMEFHDVQMSAGYIYLSAGYTERTTFG